MPLPGLAELSPGRLRQEFLKDWHKGRILSAWLLAEQVFPLRLRFRKPTPADWRQQLIPIQAVVEALSRLEHPLQIDWDTITTRLGPQLLPHEIRIASLTDYLAWLGLEADFERFVSHSRLCLEAFPALKGWLAAHPHRLLGLDELTLNRALAVCRRLVASPRPGCYLRELDVAGVDSKFIEAHKGLLRAWLDLLLPPEAIEQSVGNQFETRYGLRTDEPLIRFRYLDEALRPLPALSDLSVPVSAFRALAPPCRRVYICENKASFLSFPAKPESLLIFGAGRAVDLLARVIWLDRTEVIYWGDIDSHGFAILSSLRRHLPRTRSLLMDQATLLAHRQDWGEEPVQASLSQESLARLSPAEQACCLALLEQRHGSRIRLEQEKISQSELQAALDT